MVFTPTSVTSQLAQEMVEGPGRRNRVYEYSVELYIVFIMCSNAPEHLSVTYFSPALFVVDYSTHQLSRLHHLKTTGTLTVTAVVM